MNSLEIIDKKEQLRIKANTLLDLGVSECRKLTETEEGEYNAICKEIADLELELRKTKETNTKTEKRMGKFSLIKAINDVANNRQLDERSMEIVNAGIEEMRKSGQSYSGQIQLPVEERADVKATVVGAGTEVVATDKLNILEPLRANLVLTAAGATYMSGLIGNVSIPAYSGSNVNWGEETSTATDGAGTFKEVKLEPKRLTAYLDISKQFLIQDSASAEEMLRNDIVRAIATKLEATVFGTEAGTNNRPAGFFNGVSADTTAVDYKAVVAMEESLEAANVMGDLTFVVAPNAKSLLKTTLKSANVAGYLMEGNEMDGIKVLSSSSVASKGVVLGNFADYVVGQWGGIDLTVDPYTKATEGKVRLVINTYFDAKPRRTEAFAKKILK